MNHETLLAQGPVDVTVRCCSVEGAVVLPRYAYTSDEDWLSHFEATFPERAKKMHAYSERHGWGNWAHVLYWTQAALSWLSKNAVPND